MPKDVGKRVTAAREALCVSQDELSRISGVSRVTISRIESGKLENIHSSTAIALARALGVDVGYLLCG